MKSCTLFLIGLLVLATPLLAEDVDRSYQMDATVDLKIYDVAGRLVRTAFTNRRLDAGRRDWAWNGADDSGRSVATGVCLYQVEAGTQQVTGRMTLVR